MSAQKNFQLFKRITSALENGLLEKAKEFFQQDVTEGFTEYMLTTEMEISHGGCTELKNVYDYIQDWPETQEEIGKITLFKDPKYGYKRATRKEMAEWLDSLKKP